MGSDNVLLVALDARESIDVYEFGQGALAHVEQSQDWSTARAAGEGANFQQALLLVAGIDSYRLADDRRTEDDGFVMYCARGHSGDEVEIMLAWLVGEVDGSTRDTAPCGVERRVRMRSLEHVPVWEDVEVGGQ